MKFKHYELPDNLLYNKDSSWVRVEKDIATIGIISPIAKALKEFLFIKLPDTKNIKAGDTYVSVETLKWSGHFTSPVSGEIIETNDEVYEQPSKVNEDPYNKWIIKVKLSNKEELDKLYKPQDIRGWFENTIK